MVVPFGLVVRISGSHPGGPGSIPGMGTLFSCQAFFFFLSHKGLLILLDQIDQLAGHIAQWKLLVN